MLCMIYAPTAVMKEIPPIPNYEKLTLTISSQILTETSGWRVTKKQQINH